MKYYVDLDINADSEDEFLTEYKDNDSVEIECLCKIGPAGGNPVYRFKSDKLSCLMEVIENYCGFDYHDSLFFMNRVKKI